MLINSIHADGPTIKMVNSDAVAVPLLLHNGFGMDIIRFPAGGCVQDHTHPGDHILIVIDGSGYVDCEGLAHPLDVGTCYLIPGGVRHGVRAPDQPLTLLAIANDHRPAGSPARLKLC